MFFNIGVGKKKIDYVWFPKIREYEEKKINEKSGRKKKRKIKK